MRETAAVVVVCDLDGVVWLAAQPIPGAAEAVALLRRAGHRVVFVSNNSFSPVTVVEGRLAAMGVPAAGDVITSAEAAASLVQPGERVLLVGGPGIEGALRARGCVVDRDTDRGVDAVVVGFDRSFDYEAMRRCAAAVRHGARLIGTNPDPTFPTPEGPIPGGGAILAAVAAAAGVTPVIAGKPHPPMAAVVRARVTGASRLVMIGDRVDTDGRFAEVLGARFALVCSGVTGPDEALRLDPRPDLVAADLLEAARMLVEGHPADRDDR